MVAIGTLATVRIQGRGLLDRLMTASEETKGSAQLIAAQAANEYFDMVREKVPDYMSEKIFADIIAVGPGSYSVIFRSRGEPSARLKQTVNIQGLGFREVREQYGMDAIIQVELEKAVTDTLDDLETELVALSNEDLLAVFAANDIIVTKIGIQAPRKGIMIRGVYHGPRTIISPTVFGGGVG